MTIEESKQKFLESSLACSALKFGDFTLKSGRRSPYFFNLGLFARGCDLSNLATAYAGLILQSEWEFDVLFGPAYKGISVAALAAAKLSELGNNEKWDNIEYAYNRKEKKDHGEGGLIVGPSLEGKKIVIIDDVLTTGKAINEAIEIVKNAGGTLQGIILALDRQEGPEGSQKSTVELFSQEHKVPVLTIANLDDIVTYFGDRLPKDQLQTIREYQDKYVRR